MKKKLVSRFKIDEMSIQGKLVFLGKILILAGALVSLFLFSGLLGMRFAVRGHVMETPSVMGMSLESAEELFAGSELELVIGGRRFDRDIPSGALSTLPLSF